MHKYLLLSFSFLLAIPSFSQVSQKYIGRSGRSEYFTNFTFLTNGNKVAVGYAYTGANVIGSDALITCLDATDNILWSKEIGTSNTDRFLKVTPTSDGGCVAVGVANITFGSNNYALAVKFTSTGTISWSKTFNNTTAGEIFHNVKEVPGNGHIVCCGSYNSTPSLSAGLIVDLDASGNMLWSKSYDNPASDQMWDVVIKGNDIIASGFYTATTFYDGYLLEVDESNGNIKWAHSYDYTSTSAGNTGQWPQGLQLSGNRIYADVYVFNTYGITNDNHSVVSFDTAGLNPQCLDYVYTGNTFANASRSLVVSPTEIYLLQSPNNTGWDNETGITTNAQMKDVVVTKIKSLTAPATNTVYTRTLSTTGEQHIRDIQVTNGKFIGFGGGYNDPLLQSNVDGFKLEADTSFPVTSINCASNVTAPVFGNPTVTLNTNLTFNSITNLTFASPQLTLTNTSATLSIIKPCTTDTLPANPVSTDTSCHGHAGPTVHVSSDGNKISCYSRSIQLHATGALSYAWSPDISLNDPTIPSPIATPTTTTLYTVVGTDSAGCKNTDTITIISYGNSAVFIPNAFSPNGDHNNDDIRPTVFCNFTLDRWEIFNRWGQSVFSSNNLNTGWDGRFNDQPAPFGVYIYYIKGRNDDGTSAIYKGNITLLR